MKRYLIRSDFDPLINPDPTDYVRRNFVGGNSGNLMFAYGVMNVLKTENTEISFTYKWKFTDAEAEEINEKYDAFILPMADAFREGFVKQLVGYTELINRLRIPVIVIGIAVRTDYEPDFSRGLPFDDAARDFLKAVRDHSAMIGLRGEITADYLSHLGFSPEQDFTPVGCPSLYTYGNAVRTKAVPEKIEHLAVNTNGYYDVGHINEFLLNTVKDLPDYYLIQQIQDEYQDMFIGNAWISYLLRGKAKDQDKLIIKGEALSQLYKNDRVRFFFDVPSWINFMKPFDLFVGNRFHGSVAAILAGLPHVMIPFNARTRELTEYHHLTCLKPDEVRENTSVLDYLDQLDFQSFAKHQEENLKHYISFLEKNGLEHIFKDQLGYQMGESPMERQIQAVLPDRIDEYCHVVHDYKSLSFGKKVERAVVCNVKDVRFGVQRLLKKI